MVFMFKLLHVPLLNDSWVQTFHCTIIVCYLYIDVLSAFFLGRFDDHVMSFFDVWR